MCKYFIFYLAVVTKVIAEVLSMQIHVVTYSENEPKLFNSVTNPETVCSQITIAFNKCDKYTACCKLFTFMSWSLFKPVCGCGVIFKKLGICSLILTSKPVTSFENSIQVHN